MSYAVTPLTDDELDRLDDFFYSDAAPEESLDLIGVHGLLCAVNIGPEKIEADEWLDVIFNGEEPQWQSAGEKTEIEDLLLRLAKEIGSTLYNDEELDVPCDLTIVPEPGEDLSDLVAWTQAFMEGVFLREELWLDGPQADQSAELLLPIMVISDLFDEKEMKQMRKDKSICAGMCAQVPELLIDLFLLFHAPEK
ncbi:MAG: YecA family protein [Marinobacterium sp.]|nr:YecA family protein [Marinobacterium sp.]